MSERSWDTIKFGSYAELYAYAKEILKSQDLVFIGVRGYATPKDGSRRSIRGYRTLTRGQHIQSCFLYAKDFVNMHLLLTLNVTDSPTGDDGCMPWKKSLMILARSSLANYWPVNACITYQFSVP
jgi:hypothetical protein